MRSRLALTSLCLGLALTSCAGLPKGPVLGSWHGEPPGPYPAVPEVVDLTLYGAPGASTGRYAISTDVLGDFFRGNTGLRSWSGIWTRERTDYNGQPQTVIYLHDALASDIDQYAIGPDDVLEPTSAYLGRPLTGQEIALYSLRPVPAKARPLIE